MQAKTKYALSGTAAGLVNGLFGGGGGMVLVPLLNRLVRSEGQTGLRHLRGGHTAPKRRQCGSIPAAAALRLGRRAAVPHRRTGRRAGGRTAVPPGQRHMAAGTVRRLSAVRRREVPAVTDWLLPLAAGVRRRHPVRLGRGRRDPAAVGYDPAAGRTPAAGPPAVNLLYFLPTAAMGVVSHARNGLLEKNSLCAAVPWGAAAAVGGALLATAVDTDALRRPLRGIPAAGGHRQPAAAMAGAKAALTHIRQRIV